MALSLCIKHVIDHGNNVVNALHLFPLSAGEHRNSSSKANSGHRGESIRDKIQHRRFLLWFKKYKSVDKVHDGALNIEVQPDRGLIPVDEIANILTAVVQAKVDEIITSVIIFLIDPTNDQTGIGRFAADAIENIIQGEETIRAQAVVGPSAAEPSGT